MDKDSEVMLPVKEWAERAGLKLHNYDGFTEIYSKLSGNSSNDFITQMTDRFRDAGDLLCTRRAFESRLMECTMQYPHMSQYEKMADVIPEFVESNINLNISAILGQLRHYTPEGDALRTELEMLLSFMKHKVTAREKSIEINGITEEVATSKLDETRFTPSELEIIKNHKGTIEGLEVKLMDEVIQSLEEILQRQRIDFSEVPMDKIKILTSILYSTARQHVDYEKIDEEFMYMNITGQKKEAFIKTYSFIDGEGIKTGVTFDMEDETGRVRGAMPTTPEMDRKIKEKTGQNKDIVDEVLTIEESSRALQVIDSEVSPEERISLKTRIKNFVKRMFDKIMGRNEER